MLDFKYALRRIIIRNSIEPSRTGNCTKFDDALCQSTGLINFSLKQKKRPNDTVIEIDNENVEAERMLIHIDDQSPNCLKDNILYYIGGFIVRHLLHELECLQCKKQLLLDPNSPCARNMTSCPIFAKFTTYKQHGGLVQPSPAVLKIIKATEVVFKRRVIDTGRGITTEKMIDLKIETAVIQ